MSYPTQPVFIHKGSWNANTRLHPVMEWMEQYTYEFDRTRAFATGSPSEWLTPDFSVQHSDGTRFTGMEAAVKSLTSKYAPFSGGHKHDPTELLTWEEGEQWCMFGHAKCFIGFDGASVAADVTDLQGRSWNVVVEATYRFVYVRDESGHGGIKMKETRIYADPMPAVEFMLKHNIASAKDLGLA
jgi:hypothetical protein